jgi:2-dehydropantoate 2-reductase
MADSQIVVLGVGAIGGVVAADLLDLGRVDVRLIARTPFSELVLDRPEGTSRHRIPALCSPADLSGDTPADWVLLATKAHQSPEARPWLDRLVGTRTRVAALQNGIDQVERISALAPGARAIVPVVVQLPAERRGPGHIWQQRQGILMVPDDEDGRDFASLFADARTRVLPRRDFHTQAWWKLIMNAGSGAVCALVVRDNRAEHDPEIRALVLALMREAASVGRAEGADLPDDAPEKALDLALSKRGPAHGVGSTQRGHRPPGSPPRDPHAALGHDDRPAAGGRRLLGTRPAGIRGLTQASGQRPVISGQADEPPAQRNFAVPFSTATSGARASRSERPSTDLPLTASNR